MMNLIKNLFSAEPVLFAYYDKLEIPDQEMADLLNSRNGWSNAVTSDYGVQIDKARSSGKPFVYSFRCGAILTTHLSVGDDNAPTDAENVFYIMFRAPAKEETLRDAIQLELDLLRLGSALQRKLMEFNEFARTFKSSTPWPIAPTLPTSSFPDDDDDEDDDDVDECEGGPINKLPLYQDGKIRTVEAIVVKPLKRPAKQPQPKHPVPPRKR